MNLIATLQKSTIARNTGWMFAGYGSRILIQAMYFVLIARSLGAQQYGAFVAVTALISIIAPFAGIGATNLVVKNVARTPSLLPEYWGNGLLMTCSTGAGFLLLVAAANRLLLPRSVGLSTLMLVGASDLILSRVIDLAACTFQAVEALGKTAQIQVFPSFARLVGIIALKMIVPHPSAATWALAYLAATAASTIFSLGSVTIQLGRPRLALHRIRPELAEGFYFSVSLAAQSIYSDVDKTMLARIGSLDAAGIYAAACRIIDVSFTPVRSLLNAAYPGFFRHGKEGIHSSFVYSRRLARPAVVYSIGAAAALLVGAPLLPWLLGLEFARTANALRWMALLPLIKTIHYFFADALTGAGFQGMRTCAQIIVAVASVLLNAWAIPIWGWRGAVWSSIASDSLLAILMSAIVFALHRRLAPASSTPAPSPLVAERT